MIDVLDLSGHICTTGKECDPCRSAGLVERLHALPEADRDLVIRELSENLSDGMRLLTEAARHMDVYRAAVMALARREGGSFVLSDAEIAVEGYLEVSPTSNGTAFSFRPMTPEQRARILAGEKKT